MARSALRVAGLGLAVLWQGCGGEDIVVPPPGDEPGVVDVSVTTAGDSPDPDGYIVRFDSLEAAVGATGTTRFPAPVGDHLVAVDGIAANCAVQGDGPSRTVSVAAGDTVAVAFAILCNATTGGIVITTSTTGRLQDPDGYAVAVDGGAPQPIPVNGTVTVGGLAPGAHTAELSGLADNCRLRGDNPLTLEVTTGTTTPGQFEVTCTGVVSQWTPVDAGTNADLTDVWSSSPSSVFIVGEATTSRGSRLASVIRRFDGTQWTEQFRESDLRLRGLWGSGPTNVYAVGFDFFDPVARMLHYDGTGWTEVPGFVSSTEQLSFTSIWGSSANDVFVVGGAFDGAFDRALIYHFAGDFWQRMLVTGDLNPTLTDVWGVSSTDVYAVGIDTERDPTIGVVEHYDGTAWTPVLTHPGLAPNAVWASSPSDVFVAGFQADEQRDGNFKVTSAIWHYDGTSWAPMSVPTGSLVLEEIWGSSPSDVYVAADDGFVLHYDGTQWTAVQQTDQTLLGVFGSSAADVYAVGLNGRVIHGTP